MGIRDDEIKRLTKYAEGLNIKVVFKPYQRGIGSAEWDIENRQIVVFQAPGDSKTKIILAMLHELGHHLDWIYNNKHHSEESLKAFELLNEGSIEGHRFDIPKKYRKIIYEEEKSGIAYMSIIAKECDIKIPHWKVQLEQYMDLLDYEWLYKKGAYIVTGKQIGRAHV